ncbi:hypothetical protein GNF78_18315 [Clostridium perfringens]
MFTDNFFDLIPGQHVTGERRRRGGIGSQAFVTGSPGALSISTMRDYTAQ